MAKGKGQIQGWITKNGIHIPIYSHYSVRGGEEPTAKGAKWGKKKKKPATQEERNNAIANAQKKWFDNHYTEEQKAEMKAESDAKNGVTPKEDFGGEYKGKRVTNEQMDKILEKSWDPEKRTYRNLTQDEENEIFGKKTSKPKRGMTNAELDAANRELDAKDALTDMEKYEAEHPMKKGKTIEVNGKKINVKPGENNSQAIYRQAMEEQGKPVDKEFYNELVSDEPGSTIGEGSRKSREEAAKINAQAKAEGYELKDKGTGNQHWEKTFGPDDDGWKRTITPATEKQARQSFRDKKAQELGFADDASMRSYNEETGVNKETWKGQESSKVASNGAPRVSDEEALSNKEVEWNGQRYQTRASQDWDREKNQEYTAGHLYVPIDPEGDAKQFFVAQDGSVHGSASEYLNKKAAARRAEKSSTPKTNKTDAYNDKVFADFKKNGKDYQRVPMEGYAGTANDFRTAAKRAGVEIEYDKGDDTFYLRKSKQDSLSASMNERSRIRGELHAKDKAMKAAMPTTVSGLRSAYADATGSMKSKIAAELRRKGYSLVGGKWVKGRKE